MSGSETSLVGAQIAYLDQSWPHWLPPVIRSSLSSGNVSNEVINDFYDIVATLRRRHGIVNDLYLDLLMTPFGILGKELKRENDTIDLSIASVSAVKQRILQLLEQGGICALVDPPYDVMLRSCLSIEDLKIE